jgi:cytoplasmic iron level regulating protein YaaA (DUF328/UPF0246 family)
VLYQALNWNTLSVSAKKRAANSIVIISAKYGAITPLTKIENYKEKIDNQKMAPNVAEVLDSLKPKLIVDCRSSTYKTVWHAPLENTVEIHVSTVVDGVRKVVTHMSKKHAVKLLGCFCKQDLCLIHLKIYMQFFLKNIHAL